MSANIRLFFLINKLAGRNRIIDAFGRAGAEWVLPAMGGWFLVAAYTRFQYEPQRFFVAVLSLMLTGFFGLLLSYGIAWIVREPRPYITYPGQVKTLFAPLFSWKSFPSDHALAAGLTLGMAYCFGLPWMVPLALMALWVVWGRIYAGLHYPLDIFGGLTLAVIVLVSYGIFFLPTVERLGVLLLF